MTRPFGLRDLGLVWSLRGQGLTLDLQRAVLRRQKPLEVALTGLVPARRLEGTRTYVCQGEDARRPGFVQVLTCPDRMEWQVIRLAPWAAPEGPQGGLNWAEALGEVCARAGAWGALRVRAGVPAGGSEEEAFRQAGFAVYAREEIFRLGQPRPPVPGGHALRPLAERDGWPLAQLVGQVVPPPVQHAEGLTVASPAVPILNKLGVNRENGYVLERGPELWAYIGLSRGPALAWARILLHPEARDEAGSVVRCLLALVPGVPELYCAVRDYQGGLRGALTEMGFQGAAVQAWLVKHIARLAECGAHWQRALETRPEPVPRPMHPVNEGAMPHS